MKIEIKLIIMFLALTSIPLFFIGMTSLSTLESVFEKQIIDERSFTVSQEVEELHYLIGSYTSEVMLFHDLPPVQGIIRSRETGIDPYDNSTYELWRERFEIIFRSLIRVNPAVDQIRYIDEEGNELVRVDHESPHGTDEHSELHQNSSDESDGDIFTVPPEQLQNKADSEYFIETMKLDEGEFYVSGVDLNREHNEIEIPHKPVVRIATPVFDEVIGERKGLIVINVRMAHILDLARKTTVGHMIVTDEEGNFLVNPDTSKEFGKDLETDYNYFTEHPELLNNTQNFDAKNYYDSEEGEYRVWRKLYFNPTDKDRYIVLYSVISEDELLLPVKNLQSILALVTLFVLMLVGIMGFFIARSLSEPIKELTETIDQISKGDLKVRVSGDLRSESNEIGQLSRSFERVMASLKLAILRTGMTKAEMGLGEALLAKQEAQDAQKDAEEQLKDLILTLDNSSIVAITDKAGTITFSNEKFSEISGYSHEEIIGQNHRIVKSGFHTPEFYDTLWKTISGGKIWKGDIRNRAKDGSIYWIRGTILPRFNDKKEIIGYAAVRTPITDLMKPYEDVLEKLNKGQPVDSIMSKIIEELKTGNYKLYKGIGTVSEVQHPDTTKPKKASKKASKRSRKPKASEENKR